jgi:hypothetical protein
MTRTIVKAPLDPGKASKPTYRTATVDGKKVRIRVIDVESPTFSADLLAGFRSSIRQVRKENRELGLTN